MRSAAVASVARFGDATCPCRSRGLTVSRPRTSTSRRSGTLLTKKLPSPVLPGGPELPGGEAAVAAAVTTEARIACHAISEILPAAPTAATTPVTVAASPNRPPGPKVVVAVAESTPTIGPWVKHNSGKTPTNRQKRGPWVNKSNRPPGPKVVVAAELETFKTLDRPRRSRGERLLAGGAT